MDSLISEKKMIVSDFYKTCLFIDSKYECTTIYHEVEIPLPSQVIVLMINGVDE